MGNLCNDWERTLLKHFKMDDLNMDEYEKCKEHGMLKYSDHYDREGKPMCCLISWGKKLQDPDYQTVKQTTVGEWWVSTVWLGMDHSWGDGPPLIFETMIFPSDESCDYYQDRYSTEAEAKKGHKKAIKYAKTLTK